MQKRKRVLILAMSVLVAVILIGYGKYKEKDAVLLKAVRTLESVNGFVGTTGIIESASYIGNKYLEDEEKESILTDAAMALGITDGFKMAFERSKNRESKSLSKKGINSETILSIVTLEDKDEFGRYSFAQYITCKISIDNSPESVCYYADKLRTYLRERELIANVTSTFISSFDKELETNTISWIADEILKNMDAELVAENRTKDLFSVYAYSKNIVNERDINIGYIKTNVNIAANYNENLKQTRIYLATPVLDIEY